MLKILKLKIVVIIFITTALFYLSSFGLTQLYRSVYHPENIVGGGSSFMTRTVQSFSELLGRLVDGKASDMPQPASPDRSKKKVPMTKTVNLALVSLLNFSLFNSGGSVFIAALVLLAGAMLRPKYREIPIPQGYLNGLGDRYYLKWIMDFMTPSDQGLMNRDGEYDIEHDGNICGASQEAARIVSLNGMMRAFFYA